MPELLSVFLVGSVRPRKRCMNISGGERCAYVHFDIDRFDRLSLGHSPVALCSGRMQAVIIAEAEKQLYLGTGEVQGEMYPAIMVIGTSVLGVATTHRLKSEKVLGHWTAWLVFSIFASKLVLLILPQVAMPSLLLKSFFSSAILSSSCSLL